MTDTLIEAVAREMYERRGEREGQWDNTMKQSHYRDLAQAAIASVIAHATSADLKDLTTKWVADPRQRVRFKQDVIDAITASLTERKS